MAIDGTHGTGPPIDLAAGSGSGPLVGHGERSDLQRHAAGVAGRRTGSAEHVNGELDVLVVGSRAP